MDSRPPILASPVRDRLFVLWYYDHLSILFIPSKAC